MVKREILHKEKPQIVYDKITSATNYIIKDMNYKQNRGGNKGYILQDLINRPKTLKNNDIVLDFELLHWYKLGGRAKQYLTIILCFFYIKDQETTYIVLHDLFLDKMLYINEIREYTFTNSNFFYSKNSELYNRGSLYWNILSKYYQDEYPSVLLRKPKYNMKYDFIKLNYKSPSFLKSLDSYTIKI